MGEGYHRSKKNGKRLYGKDPLAEPREKYSYRKVPAKRKQKPLPPAPKHEATLELDLDDELDNQCRGCSEYQICQTGHNPSDCNPVEADDSDGDGADPGAEE